jgi:hypothetical protein
VSELERWERITASKDDGSLPTEDGAFRDAWSSLRGDLDKASAGWTGPDPDDVWAAVCRAERKRRQAFQFRGVALAAGILLMIGVVGLAYWKTNEPVEVKNRPQPRPILVEAGPWEDGWDESAAQVDATLVAHVESFRLPPTVPWIDVRIQQLFVDLMRVWQTL